MSKFTRWQEKVDWNKERGRWGKGLLVLTLLGAVIIVSFLICGVIILITRNFYNMTDGEFWFLYSMIILTFGAWKLGEMVIDFEKKPDSVDSLERVITTEAQEKGGKK